jgi:transposase-like protein
MEDKFYCRGNPKFTDEDKEIMFNMKTKQNKRLREIAERFECSTTIVHRYIQQQRQNII